MQNYFIIIIKIVISKVKNLYIDLNNYIKNILKFFYFQNIKYNLNTYLTLLFFEILKIVSNKNQKKFIICNGPDLKIYNIQTISLISISLRISGFFLIFISLILYSILDILLIENFLNNFNFKYLKEIKNLKNDFFNDFLNLAHFVEKNTIKENDKNKIIFETLDNDFVIKVLNNENYTNWKKFIASNLYFLEKVVFGETSFINFNEESYYIKDKFLILSNEKDILDKEYKESYLLNSQYKKHPFLYQIYVFDILDIFGSKSLDIFEKKYLNEYYSIMQICLNSDFFILQYPIQTLKNYNLTLLISIIVIFICSHFFIALFKNKKEMDIKNIYNFYHSDIEFTKKIIEYINIKKKKNIINRILLDFIKKYLIISKSLLNWLYEIFNFGKIMNFDFMDPIRSNWIFLKWSATKINEIIFYISSPWKQEQFFTAAERFTKFEEKYLSHLSITLRYMLSRIIGYYIIIAFPKSILIGSTLIFNFTGILVPDLNNIYFSSHLNNNILNYVFTEINNISNKFINEFENTPRTEYDSETNKVIETTYNGRTYKDFSIHNLNSFFYNRQYILRYREVPVRSTFFKEDYSIIERPIPWKTRIYPIKKRNTTVMQYYFDEITKNKFRVRNYIRFPVSLSTLSTLQEIMPAKNMILEFGCRYSIERHLTKEIKELYDIFYNYYTYNIDLTDAERTEYALRKEALFKILYKMQNIETERPFTNPEYIEHYRFIGPKSEVIIRNGGMDRPFSYNFLLNKGWIKIYDEHLDKYHYEYYTSRFMFNTRMTQHRFYDPKVARFFIKENGIHVGN